MYRLIIADDEPWVAYRLSHLVSFNALGFEVVDTAPDGSAALALCRRHQADALITDIRMPGLDGLDLLHALRESNMNTEVVLVSGYAEFAYAQSAVRDGAFDYLVKQVSDKQLEEVLVRLKQRLDQKCNSRRASQDLNALLGLFGEDDSSVSQWLARYYQPSKHSFFCLGVFTTPPEEAVASLHTGKGLITAVIPCAEQTIPPHLLLTEARCGLSMAGAAEEAIGPMHKQSSIAYLTACFLQHSGVVIYQAPSMAEENRLLRELEAALSVNESSRCLSLLKLLEQRAYTLNIAQITQVYNRLCRLFTRYQNAETYTAEELDYRLLAQNFANVRELFAFFCDGFNIADVPDDSCFDEVLRLIDESFTQDLRISDLAAQFHFSSSYFSTLFHKRVGVTFTKYLTEKRMSMVKELLCDRSLSLQEIAEKSGYSDYFQFNKMFKKYSGIAPGQYRQRLLST